MFAIATVTAQENDRISSSDYTLATCDPNPANDKNLAGASKCVEDFIRQLEKTEDSTRLDASYALGVRFQREVAREFKQLNYAQFLLGSLDEADNKTRFQTGK